VRLATLAYWTPALGIDAVMLWRGGLSQETAVRVSSALFRETVLFLAVWFALGMVQALLFGRNRERRMPRKVAARGGGPMVTPTRERRSH
jgi:hypothetical protein